MFFLLQELSELVIFNMPVIIISRNGLKGLHRVVTYSQSDACVFY